MDSISRGYLKRCHKSNETLQKDKTKDLIKDVATQSLIDSIPFNSSNVLEQIQKDSNVHTKKNEIIKVLRDKLCLSYK